VHCVTTEALKSSAPPADGRLRSLHNPKGLAQQNRDSRVELFFYGIIYK
jgi:hypothetical protein